MKVLGIEAQKIKKLKLVKLDLDGENLIVSGKPDEGKTTLISLLWMAMSAKGVGKEIITKGEEKAQITITLGDPGCEYSVIVTRTFTEKSPSGYLRIKDSQGKTLKESFLKDLVSSLTFDPLHFLSLKGLEQTSMLLSVGKVDTEELLKFDKMRDEFFEDRRSFKRSLAQWNESVKIKPPETKRIDIQELTDEMAAAKEHNENEKRQKDKLKTLVDELKDLESKKKEIEMRISVISPIIEKGGKVCAAHEPIDEKAMVEKLKNLQTINLAANKFEQWETAILKQKEMQNTVDDLNEKIAGVDSHKAEMLAKAKWPIKGMGIRDGEVTYKDTLLKECGTSLKLQVSFAMAAALNPTLKCCRLDGGESLGKDGRMHIIKMAEKCGFQVLMSRVADDGPGEGELVIEEGTINNQN